MQELPIITQAYDLILYLIPQIAKFPKQQRYTIGERLENMTLDFLSLLVEARYSREKAGLLQKANMTLEKIRYCVRLCKDLKAMNLHVYEVLSKRIHETGGQLGGWLKQART